MGWWNIWDPIGPLESLTTGESNDSLNVRIGVILVVQRASDCVCLNVLAIATIPCTSVLVLG
jgi:hypothetical protein